MAAAAAWAGEERRSQGEAGLPAPLSRVWYVEAEGIKVHIALPPPKETLWCTISVRSELKIRNTSKGPAQLDVGFLVTDPRMPPSDYSEHYPGERRYPLTTVELDGEPIPARYLFYVDLPDPRTPEVRVQEGLEELHRVHAQSIMYKHLSEKWGHEALMLNPVNGQLIRSYTISSHRPFGAVVFPITLQPETTHTLVVNHKQQPGMQRAYVYEERFIALRFLLTRIAYWGGSPETTIDVTVPEGWGKVATRPPPGRVIPTDSGTTYRINFSGRPVEELYLAAGSPRP
jgi:hypothetical protein